MTPKWIAAVDEIDQLLHSLGVPDRVRLKAVSEIAGALARADKERRDDEVYMARCKQADRLLPLGATEAAREIGCHRVTVYRRAKVARAS